jgi:tRNA threonylcarbamoyladenosine biosynthesis protein TsaB
MIVLAFDGALQTFSAAVASGDEIVAATEIDAKRALEAGLAALRNVMSEARVDPTMLSRLAVGVGPGSFTGIRIAISYAKALALGWSVPLVAISSYDILEGTNPPRRALAVVTGRRGIICARFRQGNVAEHACGAPRDVVGRIVPSTSRLTVFGDAEDVLDVLAERGMQVERASAKRPAAETAALLASKYDPAPSPHAVRPEYGERPAATIPRSGSLR